MTIMLWLVSAATVATLYTLALFFFLSPRVNYESFWVKGVSGAAMLVAFATFAYLWNDWASAFSLTGIWYAVMSFACLAAIYLARRTSNVVKFPHEED